MRKALIVEEKWLTLYGEEEIEYWLVIGQVLQRLFHDVGRLDQETLEIWECWIEREGHEGLLANLIGRGCLFYWGVGWVPYQSKQTRGML